MNEEYMEDKAQINISFLPSPSTSPSPSVITSKDPRETPFRYLILALVATLAVGSFYIYDNPAVLESQLKSVLLT